MKHRFLCAVLALVMMLSIIPTANAAEHGFTDIVGHWAEADILWTVEQGLFKGTSATTFDPKGTMTRGMFVTVLGRYGQIDQELYQDWYLPTLFADLNCRAYYAPYINWAVRSGIAESTGADTFSPDRPITREEMAVFLVRFAQANGFVFQSILEDVPETFDDLDALSGFAREAVEIMRRSGVLRGRANANGGYDFDPTALAARSECAAMFHRLALSLAFESEPVSPASITVSMPENALSVGDTLTLQTKVAPANVTNATLLWVSSDPAVASVNENGTVTCNAEGTAEIYAYTWNGMYDYAILDIGMDSDGQPAGEAPSDVYIGYEGESHDSKCMNIFGKVVDDPRHPYKNNSDPAEFEANLTSVTVRCWDYKKGIGSEKITKTYTIQVHKNLAATVVALFEELYACEEQYPVNYLGGYRFCNKSEHSPGLAIDINYRENPYVDPDGNVITGDKFDPENNPYSFELDGEVEQIFEKYGFRRGTWWKSGYKDYMHFSFFGT